MTCADYRAAMDAYLDDELQSSTPGAEQRLASANPERVKTLPLPLVGGRTGRLIVGVNPRRPFDGQYRSFLHLVADQFRTVMMPKGPEFIGDCQMLARIGFDNRFEPVTFDLGPGHSVAWDLRGATVTYQGRSKVTPVVPPVPGIIFLPLQHTALRNPGPAGSLRHFVEMLFWAGNSAEGWSLTWYLFEVVREDVVQIAVLNDVKTARERPGPNDRIDPRTVVSFALQSDGRLNWSIRR